MRDVLIGGRRIELAPHNCFACGTLNVHGLQLELHAAVDRCWVELELGQQFQGWEGIAHGGIVCTILDEVMAWAVVDHDMWGVTARMSVEFKKPVPLGRPIRGEGRVTGVRRRLVDAEGVVLDPADGTILARSTATFVGASAEKKAELKARYGFAVAGDATGEIATATPDRADRA
ncbi:MAG TPA: PaaI family thioesterase [Candidatus Limnocylindrales bacterium]|nr:PaaI family thioesterase [Candidatus Limnocylindrales bacterium]